MSIISPADLMTMKNFASNLTNSTPPSCASCHDTRFDNLLAIHLDPSRAHRETKQLSDYHISCKKCLASSACQTPSTAEKTGNVFFRCKQCNIFFETNSATFAEITKHHGDTQTAPSTLFSIETCTSAPKSFIDAYKRGAPIHYDNFFI